MSRTRGWKYWCDPKAAPRSEGRRAQLITARKEKSWLLQAEVARPAYAAVSRPRPDGTRVLHEYTPGPLSSRRLKRVIRRLPPWKVKPPKAVRDPNVVWRVYNRGNGEFWRSRGGRTFWGNKSSAQAAITYARRLFRWMERRGEPNPVDQFEIRRYRLTEEAADVGTK